MNVVFDLGGVVFTWDPDKLIADIIDNKEIHHIVRSKIINHHDWNDLDRGILPEEEAIQRGSNRTGIPESELRRLMQAVPPFLIPIDDTVQLIQDLKNNHNKLYVLSNMHIASINHIENKYSFWDLFDGTVVSCRINKIKPDPDIYQYLLDTYQLNINETVFIDDTAINLKTAADLGITTIKFENPDQCRNELEEIGCL